MSGHKVMTAAEMKEASVKAFVRCDIAILAAAVADFTPETASHQKIKRGMMTCSSG